jgi:hypothetical protein
MNWVIVKQPETTPPVHFSYFASASCIAAQAVDHPNHVIVVAANQLAVGTAVTLFGPDDQSVFNSGIILKHGATSFVRLPQYKNEYSSDFIRKRGLVLINATIK